MLSSWALKHSQKVTGLHSLSVTSFGSSLECCLPPALPLWHMQALWIAQEAKILHKALETVKDELSATVRELQQLPGTQPIILELKVSPR